MSSLLAERFYERFLGLSRSHGTYALGDKLKADQKGKMTGPRKTVHEPVTPDLWEKHLKGTYAIGVVPIREDSTCHFGAIDIDDYNIDIRALNERVRKLGLPLIVCRTKSGGAHLYLFTKEPVPAELYRKHLSAWAVALGYPGVEVFPKQSKLANDHDPVEANTGNWINMPYAGGEFSNRYALDPKTGDALTPEEFLKTATEMALDDADALEAVEPEIDEVLDALRGCPPCMTRGLARPERFGDWDNNMAFNFAVYCKFRYGSGWDDKFIYLCQTHLNEPPDHHQLRATINSVSRKDYFYGCRQEPIVSLCDKKACKLCEFGLARKAEPGADNLGFSMGEVVKLLTDPPTWIVTVNDMRLEVDTETFMDQKRFITEVAKKLSLWPDAVKPRIWKETVAQRMVESSEVEVPEDATREGQLWTHLAEFCTSKVTAREFDEVLLGKPYTDEAAGETYFQSAAFFKYLQQNRVSGVTERDLWRFFSRKGARYVFKKIKGKGANLWVIPAFSRQTEDFNVPTVKLPDAM